MDLESLEKILEKEPKYRLQQARDFVFKKFISNWDQATSFPKELREKLNKECPLEIKSEILVSKNGDSVKAKIVLSDGAEIETVLMRHEDGRNTVYVSCQVGCPMNCAFCATGKMGFARNLTVWEIVKQVLFFERYLHGVDSRLRGNDIRCTNVTFMGMGEPFLNYDNVLKAIKIFNSKEYFGISIRNISVSTCGVTEGINKLAQSGLQCNLAISLHAPNDKLRSELMPINKRYPLEKVLESVDDYIKKTKRKVMFEYVLIDGVNDSDECAKQLAQLMRKKLYFVNLILYNDTGVYKASPAKQVEAFKKILEKEKINFVQRYRFGDDIKAACGQFATRRAL